MKKFVAVLAGLTMLSSLAMAESLTSNPVFKQKCAMCHGANAEGKAAMKVAPMKDAASKSETELTEIITKGKPPRMPAFGSKLSAEQIKTLVEQIKALK